MRPKRLKYYDDLTNQSQLSADGVHNRGAAHATRATTRKVEPSGVTTTASNLGESVKEPIR